MVFLDNAKEEWDSESEMREDGLEIGRWAEELLEPKAPEPTPRRPLLYCGS